MKVKVFTFNPFQENTYVLYDETKEAAVIDPGCYFKEEKQALKSFIEQEDLRPVLLLNTHCHIDHVFGNRFVSQTYNILPQIHKEDLFLLRGIPQVADIYQIPNVELSPEPEQFLPDFGEITFGNTVLEIRFAPGHAPGHVIFIHHNTKTVIAGDVIFKGSIGRTDLPGGDYETLMQSINKQVLTLPDDYIIYSGHGEKTTVGEERVSNPFILEYNRI
ncbi:MAG: MBL fold metallo-hydrolase [Bacteroidetes bacterium]|nr:MAG: MBL fold metallo-hydrolase [Bacteroidota bacterium]